MPLFEYTGLDNQGHKVSGRIDGPGFGPVRQQLREKGIFPTKLQESSLVGARSRWSDFRSFLQRCSTAELASATRQLATLLVAGLSLDTALGSVAEQSDQSMIGRVLANVREEVMQGNSLHESLAKHRTVFPDLFINMVQVGENSGTLDKTLHRLADFLESQGRTRARIQAALAYPVLMTLVGSTVLVFLFVFVVPKITRMLQEMKMALPWPTLLLINLVDLLLAWWWLLLLGLVLGFIGLQRYWRTEAGRLRIDRMLLKAPLFGRLLLLIATTRFARTLGTLLQSGVPMLKALDIARTLLANRVLSRAVGTAKLRVQEGGSLAVALRETAVFPSMLVQLTAAGEQSGKLEEMLFRVADTYEHQTDLSISGMLSLLEPLMILFMGVVVGFAVLAILLPIFQASQGFG
ncbi:MAG: type II secretion system protein GspF [Desulfurivibrio sp.]|nr:type II secretion system protein GspF [Desulfurivibrio sp.]MBU4119865.1 type II secretion system inner membrane protein GspF [Pseudomonadota bacterium]